MPQPLLQLRGATGAAAFELPELPGDGSELHKAVSLRDVEYAKAGIEVEVRDKVGDVLGTAVLPMRQHHQHAKKEVSGSCRVGTRLACGPGLIVQGIVACVCALVLCVCDDSC